MILSLAFLLASLLGSGIKYFILLLMLLLMVGLSSVSNLNHLCLYSVFCFIDFWPHVCFAVVWADSSFNSIMFQLIVNVHSILMSDMPSRGCLSPVTTKKLHIFILLLFFYFYCTPVQLCYCCAVVCPQFDVVTFHCCQLFLSGSRV